MQDKLSPSYINLKNPKYIEIDNMFYGGLIVVNYYREQEELILKSLIETNINMNVSIFYEKQDQYSTIKDLTYHIGNVGVEISSNNQNRQDMDIAVYTYNDAKYIRKEMQVNGEDLYFLYIYIDIYSENIKNLEYYINKIEGIMQSKGLITRRANFRQSQVFKSCLPLMENNKDVKNSARRNILTTGLLSTYPFISTSIFDENGIFIGRNIYNNSLIFIDRYNTNKYKNANMCIFGTSGSGKSFYTKLLILRYRLLGIEQYVIDPEREYLEICKNLKGTQIKIGPASNTFVNIMEIRKESLEDGENGYLATKIGKLIGFFNLIFGELNEEEKALLEEKIIETYKLKGINFNDKSLYNSNKFKSSEEMPLLEDLYHVLEKDKRTKKFQIKLIPFVKGSFNFFNHYTNIELNNKLIIADVYELGEDNLKYGMYLFTDLFWDKIKINRKNKKAIYLDEIWRLIGVTSNKEVASFIYKIFKTIRKYGGSGVAITQDVSDLFSLEGGTYGKSILNNSSIKNFFSLEEENIKVLSENINLSEKEKIEIKSLKRGEALMLVGDDHTLVKIEASEKEKKLIEEKKNEVIT
ncbi:MAG: ATP-binding protein [Clostridia bacterium]|nr:ATP-binding protein [Clostridia bacterium]